ncbi:MULTISPECIES: hypothetical protein [Nocardia]|uniref:hypothetical protein n=1 Tax=Nocardia TaxID=1817 RepID=UPI000D689C4C|nr:MULTISPECIES: hypothetical protein [Nocardia]
MKIFYQVNSTGTYVQTTQMSNSTYDWDLFCHAFDVASLDDLFDETPAVDATPILQAAVDRMTANKAAWLSLMDPALSASQKNFWYNYKKTNVIGAMRYFSATEGGTITGTYDA